MITRKHKIKESKRGSFSEKNNDFMNFQNIFDHTLWKSEKSFFTYKSILPLDDINLHTFSKNSVLNFSHFSFI